MDNAISIEQLLNTIPHVSLDNGFVQSRISLSVVCYLADVNGVLKDQVQAAA
jgi:hypothetical protein